MYKKDLALNNLQWLICHKIKPNQRTSSQIKTELIVNVYIILYCVTALLDQITGSSIKTLTFLKTFLY